MFVDVQETSMILGKGCMQMEQDLHINALPGPHLDSVSLLWGENAKARTCHNFLVQGVALLVAESAFVGTTKKKGSRIKLMALPLASFGRVCAMGTKKALTLRAINAKEALSSIVCDAWPCAHSFENCEKPSFLNENEAQSYKIPLETADVQDIRPALDTPCDSKEDIRTQMIETLKEIRETLQVSPIDLFKKTSAAES